MWFSFLKKYLRYNGVGITGEDAREHLDFPHRIIEERHPAQSGHGKGHAYLRHGRQAGRPGALRPFRGRLHRTSLAWTLKRLLAAIFAFHPQGIRHYNIGGHDTYENTGELQDIRYRNEHRRYYRTWQPCWLNRALTR